MPLRVVMMGTGQFALPTFRTLIDSPHEVAALVTQPDRTGRGHHHHVNVMKETGLEHGIDVFQPEKARAPEALDRLRSYGADVFVVAAYGQILSQELLDIPRFGAINLHASLLPKYRGAAPVHYAILNGETESGVTMFRIVPALDAGPILGVVRTDIGPQETSGELEARLADLSGPLTLEVLERLERGQAEAIPQDESQVTLAPKMPKSMGQIDWTRTAEQVGWHVRAMQPWPMPFTFFTQEGRKPLRLLVLETQSVSEDEVEAVPGSQPGQLAAAHDKHLYVRTGAGIVEVIRLKPAGKREMIAAEFLHGHHPDETSRFGPAPE
ncbi:Methionyl-tRNA formyltransferase [Maioricimonas rarisocia]|uniref:Methionyl-tRNA formyltransferase n=1 Tax=Maioricimonas rarisocia TaxID=2528026 RepID=A0A517Z9L3_9PLAN|nr:methionyl-tRNA formyltransferase [Maioricimonas rarisocia]QDU39175.1 Methionyl-tRNA formyltransferase [Maioricimonas rarisocia]